jgi:hypothetical protein
MDDPNVLDWFDAHVADIRRNAYGPRILYSSLMAGLVLGLLAYVAGYLLRSTVPTEPLGLLADLLYAFGLALWTGVVIVVLVEVYPDVKRRQFREALDAYEAMRRDRQGSRRDRRQPRA